MLKKTLLLITAMSFCISLFATDEGGFDAYNLYSSHGVMGTWSSFGKIAASLFMAGYAIRMVVILRLAITGEGQNVVLVVAKLLAASIGVVVLQSL